MNIICLLRGHDWSGIVSFEGTLYNPSFRQCERCAKIWRMGPLRLPDPPTPPAWTDEDLAGVRVVKEPEGANHET